MSYLAQKDMADLASMDPADPIAKDGDKWSAITDAAITAKTR